MSTPHFPGINVSVHNFVIRDGVVIVVIIVILCCFRFHHVKIRSNAESVAFYRLVRTCSVT